MEKMKKRQERFSSNSSPVTSTPVSAAELSEEGKRRRREEKFSTDLAIKKTKI